MTEKYLDNPSDDTDDYSGTWHPRGETRYTVLNNNNVVFEVDKSWSNVRYYADTSLRKGLYTLYIYGDSYIDDLALLTVELEYKPLNPEGSYVSVAKVSDTTTRDNNDQLYSSLFAVGNGTSETDRKNAFEVYDDGHAEVQTQGATENSVVTNAKFKFYESEDDIPNDLPVGTIVFIME